MSALATIPATAPAKVSALGIMASRLNIEVEMDALTDAGAWHDDCQIVELSTDKLYGATRYGCAVNMMEL